MNQYDGQLKVDYQGPYGNPEKLLHYVPSPTRFLLDPQGFNWDVDDYGRISDRWTLDELSRLYDGRKRRHALKIVRVIIV